MQSSVSVKEMIPTSDLVLHDHEILSLEEE